MVFVVPCGELRAVVGEASADAADCFDIAPVRTDGGDEKLPVVLEDALPLPGGVTRVPSFPVNGLTLPFVLQLFEKLPSGLDRS
jgi:hypothetical protein